MSTENGSIAGLDFSGTLETLLDKKDETPKMDDNFYLDLMAPEKKRLTIFFLIDVSGSMNDDHKIDSVNEAMRTMMPEIKAAGGDDIDVYVAVLSFNRTARWVTNGPVRVDELTAWKDLRGTDVTYIGRAFDELNAKMSKKQFLSSPSISYAPVVFLMTDGIFMGDPTHGKWASDFDRLKKNKWFQCATKFAIGFGHGNCIDMSNLETFAGDPEMAMTMSTPEQIVKMIPFLAVSSTAIGSQSMSLSGTIQEEGITEEEAENSVKELFRETVREAKTEAVSMNDLDEEEGW